MTNNNVVCTPIAVPLSMIEEFRNAYNIKEEDASDERILEYVVGDLIDRYFSGEYFNVNDVYRDLLGKDI